MTATISEMLAGGSRPDARKPESAQEFHDALRGVRTIPFPTLVARPARTPRDAERLRRIRNTCADFMTGSNRQITPNEQAAWWASPARRRNAIWLFAPPGAPPDDAVGFGLFRMEDGVWWATLGLLPAWRGQGHGVGIYRHLIARCPGDLWIRVLLTNPGSARAAEKAGFRPVDSNGVYAELVARRGDR